jgi:hypothetical protein
MDDPDYQVPFRFTGKLAFARRYSASCCSA